MASKAVNVKPTSLPKHVSDYIEKNTSINIGKGEVPASRAEAKKILSSLAEAVSAEYSAAFHLQKNYNKSGKQTYAITTEGQSKTLEISQREITAMFNRAKSNLKKLPAEAIRLTKTHRKTSVHSGFLAARKMKPEIIRYLNANANIGPKISGTVNSSGDAVYASLKNEGGKLQSDLMFVNNTAITGITSSAILTPIFSLLSHYEKMQYPGEKSYLSSSDSMRQHLSQTLTDTISNDIARLSKEYPSQASALRTWQANLTKAVKDSKLYNHPIVVSENGISLTKAKRGRGQGKELFNPNYFPYSHISKIIAAASTPANLTPAERVEFDTKLRSTGIRGTSTMSPLDQILKGEKSKITLALAITKPEKIVKRKRKTSPGKRTPGKSSPRKSPGKTSPKKKSPGKASPKKAGASPKKASPKKASPKKAGASPKKKSTVKKASPKASSPTTVSPTTRSPTRRVIRTK